ncbi:MAG: DUF4332 domain-containing protein [Akkermansiaceae bacterium]|nr:DUF4332 domain-containing protein [Akkermansiaceae bacterium]
MTGLESIQGIGKSSLELLEAAGFRDVESVAKAGIDDLTAELTRANEVLKIAKRAPARGNVERWVKTAREIAGVEVPEEEAPVAGAASVNYERKPEVIEMLAAAPFAIPLPAKVMIENRLAVSDIPPAILLNRYTGGELEVKIDDPGEAKEAPREPKPKPASASSDFVRYEEPEKQRLEIDTSRLRSTGDLGRPLERVATSIKVSPADDRVALIRAPRTSTNKGRSPESRWYIRGVLHSHPVSIYIGALVTLVLMFLVPLAIVSAALLLLSSEKPQIFSWVPGWLLAFPALLPAFGIAYLIWGYPGSCRICTQKLFVHRSHRKNIKAHHLAGLGYVLPLCVQILLFRWFRCTHCGTPVRLKE